MDKKLLYSIAGIAAIIAGSVVYLLFANKPAQVDTSTIPSQAVAEPSVANTPVAQPGAYVDYSQGGVQSTPGKKLLFFYAPWCPQCRDLDADIKKSGVPTGVTIFKVDYDSRQDLRTQYGVTIQTTIVRVNDDGSLVKKYVAYNQPTLDAVIKNLLP